MDTAVVTWLELSMVGVGPTGLPYCRPPPATGEVERRRTEEVRCTALLYTQPATHRQPTLTTHQLTPVRLTTVLQFTVFTKVKIEKSIVLD